jgi:hypothetical protein
MSEIEAALPATKSLERRCGTWLDLVRYAQEVFSVQDTQRFVLGLALSGLIMRIWEFDWTGSVGLTLFDINKEAHMFVSVIVGYWWVSEEGLGFDPTIVRVSSERLTHGLERVL